MSPYNWKKIPLPITFVTFVCFTYEYTYWEQNALYLVNCKHFTTYRLIFSKTFVYPQTDQCNLIFQARNF